MTSHNRPLVVSDIEEAVPQTAALSTLPEYDSKGYVDHLEEKKMGDEEDEDLNSPEAILARYPLLKDKSKKDLDLLSKRLRRRL